MYQNNGSGNMAMSNIPLARRAREPAPTVIPSPDRVHSHASTAFCSLPSTIAHHRSRPQTTQISIGLGFFRFLFDRGPTTIPLALNGPGIEGKEFGGEVIY